MKVKLQALLKISLPQIVLILFVVAIKYFLNYYKLLDYIEKPFVWLCAGGGVIWILSAGVSGIIENKGQSVDSLLKKANKSTKDKLMILIVTWGIRIPIYMIIILPLFIFVPTSLLMFGFLIAVFLIRNFITVFLLDKKLDMKI